MVEMTHTPQDILDNPAEMYNDANEMAGIMANAFFAILNEIRPEFKEKYPPYPFLAMVLGNMYAADHGAAHALNFCDDCVRKAFQFAMTRKIEEIMPPDVTN